MENKLKKLIEGNSEANRLSWAMDWKRRGGKVIGILSNYVPEEVVSAAGMLPWRITGTWSKNISRARVYRGDSSCSYCNHVLESMLSGELDFLDGIIATDIDQDLLRLWDVLLALKVKPYCYAIHIPFIDSELSVSFFRDEIRRLIVSLEEYSGVKISDDSLRSSINTYNKTRTLLNRVNDTRKKDIPAISGAEMLGITTSATVMPKELFNRELETLLPFLEKRSANLNKLKPRILISSEMLDNPAYLQLVEENCVVAMDDTDTGTRYFMKNVDNDLKDPVYALATRYLKRHGDPHMSDWDKQADQIIRWVNEYKIDGVLSLPLNWCYLQRYRMPYLAKRLDDVNIPNVCIEREYHMANMGQLRTRVGAFLEMLETRPTINKK